MDRIVMGGPMMGIAQVNLQVPVIKGTTSVILISKDEARTYPEYTCIRCARCVDHCPVSLLPAELARFSKGGKWERLEEYHIMDCMECGCCAYVCPAGISIVELIKLGKLELQT